MIFRLFRRLVFLLIVCFCNHPFPKVWLINVMLIAAPRREMRLSGSRPDSYSIFCCVIFLPVCLFVFGVIFDLHKILFAPPPRPKAGVAIYIPGRRLPRFPVSWFHREIVPCAGEGLRLRGRARWGDQVGVARTRWNQSMRACCLHLR